MLRTTQLHKLTECGTLSQEFVFMNILPFVFGHVCVTYELPSNIEYMSHI